MAAISVSGGMTGNVIFRPALHELTFVSRRLLNRFEPSWARLKATLWSQINFQCTMALTSGGMTEKVTYLPTFLGDKNLSIELL